jgi:Ni,Fe-hydrogenase III small subunit
MFVLLNHLHRLRRSTTPQATGRRGSLALRHVDAGSCNGCEHELTAAANPLYDLQQYGLNVVASPRHADVLLVTGAITTRMATALRVAYDAMPEPRLVAALGDCALGCNLLGQDAELAGALEDIIPIDLRIPGCPPTPAVIAKALTTALHDLQASSAARARTDPPAIAPELTCLEDSET